MRTHWFPWLHTDRNRSKHIPKFNITVHISLMKFWINLSVLVNIFSKGCCVVRKVEISSSTEPHKGNWGFSTSVFFFCHTTHVQHWQDPFAVVFNNIVIHVLNTCLMLPISLEPSYSGHKGSFHGIIKHRLSYWLLKDSLFILDHNTEITLRYLITSVIISIVAFYFLPLPSSVFSWYLNTCILWPDSLSSFLAPCIEQFSNVKCLLITEP